MAAATARGFGKSPAPRVFGSSCERFKQEELILMLSYRRDSQREHRHYEGINYHTLTKKIFIIVRDNKEDSYRRFLFGGENSLETVFKNIKRILPYT